MFKENSELILICALSISPVLSLIIGTLLGYFMGKRKGIVRKVFQRDLNRNFSRKDHDEQ